MKKSHGKSWNFCRKILYEPCSNNSFYPLLSAAEEVLEMKDCSVAKTYFFLKYYTLFWQSLRIVLYLCFFSVRYFENTLSWDEIV